MGRYKYLLKNIGVLTLSSFATKLLSFFLVPLYTNILSTTEYGTYDLFQTTIGVLVPNCAWILSAEKRSLFLEQPGPKPLKHNDFQSTSL